MFEFKYMIGADVVYNDFEHYILWQKHKEEECFKTYGIKILKNNIPAASTCNQFREGRISACTYCVSDRCLMFGNALESGYGAYGISLQKRSKRCREKYPKGKDLLQIELEVDENE